MSLKIQDSTKPAILDIPLNIDDRGYVYCAMDNLGLEGIKRTYVVENFARGQIRAWHGHEVGATYIHVISGASKIAALNLLSYYMNSTMNPMEYKIHTLSARKPQLFYIPPGWANGHMSLEEGTKLLVYSTLSFEEVKSDDKRLPAYVLKNIWEVQAR
jgi:dTDP-4-dehydrorhamnose 3,5-epimerase-like enzyme